MTHAYLLARMVRALMDDALTKSELTERLGIHHVTTARYIHALHREGVICIIDWRRPSHGDPAPVYEVNFAGLKDVEKPARIGDANRPAIHRAYYQRKKQRALLHMMAGPIQGDQHG